MKKFLIESKVDQKDRSVWITNLETGNKYQLPLAEYVSRYKRHHGSGPNIFEWGYEGSGPNFLSWALMDELVGSEATKEQQDVILLNVTGIAQHGKDFSFTLDL
jgi:hypothetical protein